jgi:predicted TIM-barrel fold metal-dependent hydrolase
VTETGPASPTAVVPATRPGDIVDAHMHLFTLAVLEEMIAAMPQSERFQRAVKDRKWGRRGENFDLPDLSPAEMAGWYGTRLDDAGIAKGIVVATAPSEYMREFVMASDGRVSVLAAPDPRDPASVELLEREHEAGFKGVKLYPVNRCYRVSDPECSPFFDKAAELGMSFIIHYGVTVDPMGDLRYADPIDLSPVARDHPDISFVVAHFGAGWLDSVLKVAYQCKNVCVDTSGTNNWMDNYIPRLTLPEVFERALLALGPERILFGTDSGTTAPYRKWLMFQQRRVLEELGLSEGDRDLVMRANAVRIFGLDG